MQCVQQQTVEHIVAVPHLITELIGESTQPVSSSDLLKLARKNWQYFLDAVGKYTEAEMLVAGPAPWVTQADVSRTDFGRKVMKVRGRVLQF